MDKSKAVFQPRSEPVASWSQRLAEMNDGKPPGWDPVARFFSLAIRPIDALSPNYSSSAASSAVEANKRKS
jgi:hypothetical protein